MKVKYVGAFASVDVPSARLVDVARGDVVDVPDQIGKGLCEQAENWQPVKAATTKEA